MGKVTILSVISVLHPINTSHALTITSCNLNGDKCLKTWFKGNTITLVEVSPSDVIVTLKCSLPVGYGIDQFACTSPIAGVTSFSDSGVDGAKLKINQKLKKNNSNLTHHISEGTRMHCHTKFNMLMIAEH